MKFSEKRALAGRKKFEKELRSELSKWGSAHLKNAAANFVHFLNGGGKPEHFVQFILAAKFGETNSYVADVFADLRQHYKYRRIVQGLRTSLPQEAKLQAKIEAAKPNRLGNPQKEPAIMW